MRLQPHTHTLTLTLPPASQCLLHLPAVALFRLFVAVCLPPSTASSLLLPPSSILMATGKHLVCQSSQLSFRASLPNDLKMLIFPRRKITSECKFALMRSSLCATCFMAACPCASPKPPNFPQIAVSSQTHRSVNGE